MALWPLVWSPPCDLGQRVSPSRPCFVQLGCRTSVWAAPSWKGLKPGPCSPGKASSSVCSCSPRPGGRTHPTAHVSGSLVCERPEQRVPGTCLSFVRPDPQKLAELPWQLFPAHLPGDLSQSVESVSRMFTYKHFGVASQFRWVFWDQGNPSVALQGHSQLPAGGSSDHPHVRTSDVGGLRCQRAVRSGEPRHGWESRPKGTSH